MTFGKNKGPEKTKTQKEIFGSFDYKEIDVDFGKKAELIDIYEKQGLFNKKEINKWNFEDFLDKIFKENNVLEDSLIGTRFSNDQFIIYLDNGSNIKIDYKDLESFLLEKYLKGEKKEDIEKKVKNLNNAIEAIYQDNQGLIFDGEIDEKDIITYDLIKEYKLDKKYLNKGLKELKSILDIENSKLFKIYDITEESQKKQELLKKEIKFYTGIGDKYEGGAFLFNMKSEEIDIKVQELGDTMSLDGVFKYIKNINNEIDDNLRRSDKTEGINLKVINALYEYTFDRLKKENPKNEIFINFIKLITGRGKLEIDKNIKYENKTDFEYEEIDVDENFKAQNIANKALIYIMYRKGGLLEEIKEKQKFEVELEDEEMEGKTPATVLNEAKDFFDNSIENKVDGYGEKILNQLNFTQNLNKPYKDLTFDEKISIGSLVRMIKKLKTLKPGEIKDEKKLNEISVKMVKESFEELNESFSDNFNETLFDWDGTSAEDLGLKGTSAEIFELYQDINGNEGLFDWKDTNELGLKSIAVGITMVAAIAILWPLLVGGATAFTFTSGLIAGAKIGLVSGVANNVFSRQGYDTYSEGAWDVGTSISIEVIVSALLTATGLQTLKSLKLGFTPDLLFSKDAWKIAGLTDKAFMLTEAGLTMFLSDYVNKYIKKQYIEHHTDND